MATKNICTVPMSSGFGFHANAIIEEKGELKRINLEEEFNQKASRIFCEAEGESIFVDDSSEARFKNIALLGNTKQESTNGYQLFNAGYCEGVGSNSSINVSDDEYTITATGGVSAGYGFSKFPLDINKCVGKTLTMKVDSFTGGTGSGVMLYGFKGGANAVSYTLKPGDKSIECPIAEDIEEVKVYIYTNTTGNVFTEENTVIVNGLMVSYEKDVAWEKYTGENPAPNTEFPQELVSVENPKLFVVGKNIFGGDALADRIFSVSKATTSTKDETTGIVTYNGGGIDKAVILDYGFKKNQQYTLILYGQNTTALAGYINIAFLHDDGTLTATKMFETHGEDSYAVLTSEVGKTVKAIVGKWASGTVHLHYNKSGLFEGVVSKEDFETYTEQIITVPYTISGIDVTGTTMKSLANYTDADNRKWICNEVDLERGVYVQRVKCMALDENTQIWTGTHGNGQPYISVYPGDNALTSIMRSTHYRPAPSNWSNENGYIYCINTAIIILDSRFSTAEAAKEVLKTERPEIMYVLAEPIETPLTDAEIYAFKCIHSYYPNTTILNSAGAYMRAEYAADTKKFILNYIIENQAEIKHVSSVEITLPSKSWKISDDGSCYTQAVTVEGATEFTKIDLQPTPQQMVTLIGFGITIFVANEGGKITAYAVGGAPAIDMTIQAQKTEVVYV